MQLRLQASRRSCWMYKRKIWSHGQAWARLKLDEEVLKCATRPRDIGTWRDRVHGISQHEIIRRVLNSTSIAINLPAQLVADQ